MHSSLLHCGVVVLRVLMVLRVLRVLRVDCLFVSQVRSDTTVPIDLSLGLG